VARQPVVRRWSSGVRQGAAVFAVPGLSPRSRLGIIGIIFFLLSLIGLIKPSLVKQNLVKVDIRKYGIAFENNKDNNKFVIVYKHDQTTGKTPVHKLQIGNVILSEKIEPIFVYTSHPKILSLLSGTTQNTTVKATVALGSKQAYSNRIPPYTFKYVSFSLPLYDAMKKE
jgi:hypothetical protein